MPSLFDVVIDGGIHGGNTEFKSLFEHGAYKYSLHMPGQSYSGRLKYLLASGSAVLAAQRHPGWTEFWYHLLKVNSLRRHKQLLCITL